MRNVGRELAGRSGRPILIVLLACALWLPLQNLALIALALGAAGAWDELLALARPLALPLLLGAAVAWTTAIAAVVMVVWTMRGRVTLGPGGGS